MSRLIDQLSAPASRDEALRRAFDAWIAGTTCPRPDDDEHCVVDGVRYRAVDAEHYCVGCAGKEHDDLCRALPPCCPCERRDGRNIVWVRDDGAGSVCDKQDTRRLEGLLALYRAAYGHLRDLFTNRKWYPPTVAEAYLNAIQREEAQKEDAE